MGTKIGVCTNVGKCDLAKQEIYLPKSAGDNLACHACHRPLYIIEKNNHLSYIIGIAVVAAIGLGGYFYMHGASSSAGAQSGVVQTEDSGDDYSRIIQRRKLLVAVQEDGKPFFFSKNGVYGGFNYDFLQLLLKQPVWARKGDVSLVISKKTESYPEVPLALLDKDRQGNYEADIAIDGLTFLDNEGAKGVVYSDPYIEDFGYCVITMPNKVVDSVEQLAGKRVGVLAGDSDAFDAVKRKIKGAKIIELSEKPINGERIWIKHFLSTNHVDAVVYDYPFAVAEIEGRGLKIAIAKIPGKELQYKIGLRDGNPKLKEALNESIKAVKNLPEYAELLRKYFRTQNAVSAKIAEGARVHVVASGDSLAMLAEKYLGRTDRYKEIEALNNMANPNLIIVGQRLAIPER